MELGSVGVGKAHPLNLRDAHWLVLVQKAVIASMSQGRFRAGLEVAGH